MRPFNFAPEVLGARRRDRYHHPHPRVRQRRQALSLKSRGLTPEGSARPADVARRAARRYLDEFAAGGLEPLRRLPWPGKPNALAAPQACLEDYFFEHPPRSSRAAQAARAAQTGVRRGLTQVRAFLKKTLDLRWRKVGAIPAKEDPQEQAAF